MPRLDLFSLAIGLGLLANVHAMAQSTFGQPYSAQLRTDPAVGNVQGIQRYGRPLRTDPEQGEGFSFHVYPVAQPQVAQVVPFSTGGLSGQIRSVTERSEDEIVDPGALEPKQSQSTRRTVQAAVNPRLWIRASRHTLRARWLRCDTIWLGRQSICRPAGRPSGLSFDSTAGLRNYSTPLGSPEALTDPYAVQSAITAEALGLGFNNNAQALVQLYHQPLIQIKLRVVEVTRNDGLQVNSVLEYVSRDNVKTFPDKWVAAEPERHRHARI